MRPVRHQSPRNVLLLSMGNDPRKQCKLTLSSPVIIVAEVHRSRRAVLWRCSLGRLRLKLNAATKRLSPLLNAQKEFAIILAGHFYVEFFVGVCMFLIVAWLLIFRMTEVRECWKIHARIRFYFGLTLVGIAVNLGIGISGTINVVSDDLK